MLRRRSRRKEMRFRSTYRFHVSKQKRKKFALSSLAESYLGLQGQGLGRGVDGYFTALVGRILNPDGKVSSLGLDGLQEVVFQW